MSIGPKEAALRAQREAKALLYGKHNGAISMPNPDMPRLKDHKPRTKAIPKVRRNGNPATLPAKNKGGRPKKANALSNVERQRAYRERQKGKA